jgi:methionyl-tRNA formyltransferase
VPKIDAGAIIIEEFEELPPIRRTPEGIRELHRGVSDRAIQRFFSALGRGIPLPMRSLDVSRGCYFPPLNAELNGWINWEWNGDELQRWILAFSHPYNGARTTLNQKEVRIFECEFSTTYTQPHPFSYGLIVSKLNDHVRIAVKGGFLAVKCSDIRGALSRDIREGFRFITPRSALEDALKRPS